MTKFSKICQHCFETGVSIEQKNDNDENAFRNIAFVPYLY